MITEALMEIPKGHHIFGTVKVGERGQIIIPKEARELFGIKAGDILLVLGDRRHEGGRPAGPRAGGLPDDRGGREA